jgi:homopolymeric O-antigen transport system permease protein
VFRMMEKMSRKVVEIYNNGIVATLVEPYRVFWRHRHLLLNTVVQSLRSRYAGSVLGLAWLVVGPALLLALYALLYTVVFRIKPVGLTIQDYIFYIFGGFVPFIAFSQALSSGATSLIADRALLLNRLFPAELIPAREVLSAGAFVVVGGALVLAARTVLGGFSIAWILLPAVVLLFGMATMGLVWGVALANLIAKDTQQAIGYVIMLLLIASPIAYTPDMVPVNLRILLYANPLAYFIQSFQVILVLGRVPPVAQLLGCLFFALAAFHSMYWLFAKGKLTIADYI